jgi:RNA polymerase sigma-70 factor (ECF subfamily)
MLSIQEARPEKQVSDEALVYAIAEGANWAMESLYTRYHRLLYTLAYRMVTDRQIAEDLLQDAFLAVWKRSDTYSPQAGAARSWLISILHHRAIDYLRKLRRRSVLIEAPLELLDTDEGVACADVWEDTWRLVQADQVRDALCQLPREQRNVIELAYFQGWTHSEIAACTHTPLGTVKARLRLGLHHLKRTLQQMDIGIDEI